MEDAHPTTTTKNSDHKYCAAALCNNRSDNRKDLTFHVFSKDPWQRLVSPLSNASSFTITASGISFGDTFFISKRQIVFVFAAILTFFKFARNLVAHRPRFHAYVVSVYVADPSSAEATSSGH